MVRGADEGGRTKTKKTIMVSPTNSYQHSIDVNSVNSRMLTVRNNQSEQGASPPVGTAEAALGFNFGGFNANARVEVPFEKKDAQRLVDQIVDRNPLQRFRAAVSSWRNKEAIKEILVPLMNGVANTQFVEVLDRAPATINFYYDRVTHEFENVRKDQVMSSVWRCPSAKPNTQPFNTEAENRRGVTLEYCLEALIGGELSFDEATGQASLLQHAFNDALLSGGDHRGKTAESFLQSLWEVLEKETFRELVQLVAAQKGITDFYNPGVTAVFEVEVNHEALADNLVLTKVRNYLDVAGQKETVKTGRSNVEFVERLQDRVENKRRVVSVAIYTALREFIREKARYGAFGRNIGNPPKADEVAGITLEMMIGVNRWTGTEEWARTHLELRSAGLLKWPFQASEPEKIKLSEQHVVKFLGRVYSIPFELSSKLDNKELLLTAVAVKLGGVSNVMKLALDEALRTTSLPKPEFGATHEDSPAMRAREYAETLEEGVSLEDKCVSNLRESLVNDLAARKKSGITAAWDASTFYVLQYSGSRRHVHTNLTSGNVWLVTRGKPLNKLAGLKHPNFLIWRDILADRLMDERTIRVSALRECIEKGVSEDAHQLVAEVVLAVSMDGRKVTSKRGYEGCVITAHAPKTRIEPWRNFKFSERFKRKGLRDKWLIIDDTQRLDVRTVRWGDESYVLSAAEGREVYTVSRTSKHCKGRGSVWHVALRSDASRNLVMLEGEDKGEMQVEADGTAESENLVLSLLRDMCRLSRRSS